MVLCYKFGTETCIDEAVTLVVKDVIAVNSNLAIVNSQQLIKFYGVIFNYTRLWWCASWCCRCSQVDLGASCNGSLTALKSAMNLSIGNCAFLNMNARKPRLVLLRLCFQSQQMEL